MKHISNIFLLFIKNKRRTYPLRLQSFFLYLLQLFHWELMVLASLLKGLAWPTHYLRGVLLWHRQIQHLQASKK